MDGGLREQAIVRQMRWLGPNHRPLLTLRLLGCGPYEESAEIPYLPLGTVKTYIHRARAELKEALGPLRERSE